ncbi:hypothetical protein AO367_1587 [Moraxella catarrhalis]|nr:hypothetical protein AO380_1914 [Moraxella catarrhalis]OAV29962.1 hypothetical protein AO367_1587 [Moraxella catarrhalis]
MAYPSKSTQYRVNLVNFCQQNRGIFKLKGLNCVFQRFYNQCSIKINLNDWFCLHLDIIIYRFNYLGRLCWRLNKK